MYISLTGSLMTWTVPSTNSTDIGKIPWKQNYQMLQQWRFTQCKELESQQKELTCTNQSDVSHCHIQFQIDTYAEGENEGSCLKHQQRQTDIWCCIYSDNMTSSVKWVAVLNETGSYANITYVDE